ncbi:kinesin family member 26B [Rhinolophus ferrumequinum]|uniref:Kinesin family member 26B n=1 Tax=Rhinolophus ferrumequinum TaxID=59479 RepID=A0A671FJA4_RHIFE|nr:kinesin-like protein KIF26B isoform X2 [Rhinolophus ferrumequinum]KAF6274609.1 kinesin family member 26B [Rhinolophus ferrumequinum]
MNSVAGNKERLAVSTRGKKYGVNEVCSPTKPAAPFSPESWYRKAYEESRAGSRPTPEGAGSALGSSGTPSPGSGTSSPSSFTGSPGPASPGIGTSSPGSLGGSPGFGTGSPGSGSGGGSSPGSDRGVWCENCNARLVELKRQALKLLLPGPFPGKDPAFSAVIHDKLQVPNTIRKAWNDRDNRCDICATHLNQLKQEAIQMVLTLEQAAGSEHYDGSPGSPPALSSIPTLVGARHVGALQQPRDWAFVPAPCASSNYTAFVTNKHSSKPNSLGVSNGAEKKGGSPTHQAKVSLQMTTSPSNGNIFNSVAIQAHQYLDGTWSLSRTNGVTLYPYQISQLMTETGREGLTEAVLNRYNADKPAACSVPASQGSCVASDTSTGTSVAASFFARAAQKLNLSSKKKKHRPSTSSVAETPLFATSFSGILQTSPPPAPPCLLRAVSKVKDTPGLGKVKVMLRICSTLARDTSESSSFLKVDPRKKQITLYDPLTCGGQNAFQKRGNQVPPKMFAFDAVFPQDASQAEVCAGTVAEVIQSVVNGADGCVFCFGHAKLGKSYTMIGKDDSMQNLGIIPCAISWLFKLINERKEKTGARFSVRISAVEVWGKEENLRDLLSEVATGSLQDGQSPGVYLCEDPICGTQLQNQSELRAPTAEKAAFFLDAAIASRRGHQQDCDEDDHRNSHMLFTLHIYQYRMEKSGKGGMSGGRSRLHLIDLGSCVKALSKNREGGSGLCLSLSALGNVILALVNGSKHIPYKESKLTMLLRESLGNMNCRTTMIAHISAAAGNYAETLSTIQIASRVLRMKKKKTKYTSSSSGGESSCEEGRMRRPTQLRPFHARATVDSDFAIPHLSSDPDYSSSSEQSCDTVIYIGPNGTALSDKELTDNEGPPDFVPIVPALQKTRGDNRPVEAGEATASKPERDCLKCNTFAELQERLDCIDGSEEPSKFLFEELPAQFGAEQASKCPPLSQAAGANPFSESDKEDNASDGQLSDREGTDALASRRQRNHSPAPAAVLTNSPPPASPRSIPGSSSQHSSSQLVQSPSLQSSRESLNSCGFVEGKPRPMGSPRLGIASLSKTSEYKPASSPSQRCKVYTQKGILPSPAPLPPLSKDSCTVPSESLLQPEVRTPPVGMSPQVLKKSLSAGSEGFPEAPADDEHEAATSPDSKKEIVSTTMVTVQQPLELNGEDELVFTLVEELTISGVLDGGRPTSIISFNSDCSVQALASGSRPVSIIGSISEDLECYSSMAPVSEVSITQFLPLPKLNLDEKGREAGSRRSSISSWLSEMSTGSDGEQSCHSFIAQTCFGHGEAMADPPASEFVGGLQNTAVVCREKPKAGPDNVLILSEMGEDSFNKATPIKGCKISTLGKAMVTISNTANLSSCEGYIPMKTNITVYPCIAMSPRHVQETEASMATAGSASKAALSQESKETNAKKEMTFEDPWLKREEEVKRENAYPSEGEMKYESAAGPAKPEARAEREQDRKASPSDRLISSSGEASASSGTDNFRRVVDGCEMALPSVPAQSPAYPNKSLKSSSLPRASQKASRQEELDGIFYPCAPETNGIGSAPGIQPSKATLERKVASPKHCVLARPKGTPPLPPIRKSSLDQKNRASPQHGAGSGTSSPLSQPTAFLASFPDEPSGRVRDASSSSKLFSAKLEQLASRTNSLGRTTVSHYECLSLERAESLSSMSSRLHAGKDSTMPRAGRSLGRSAGASPTTPGPPQPQSAGASPKASQSKMSAVSKLLLASPKARSLSTSTTKTLSFSTKSLPQSVGQSPNPAPSAKHMSWSTQSLSRSRGAGLAAKLPLRAVNGRISELLQGTAGPRALQPRAGPDDERAGGPDDKPAAVPLLPSPYSKVTPPRKPHRCSSGHGSDNSSVLSGELPPAMGKTALFYHSGGSSGYESMIRDSEATGSASSAQDSMSENSSSVGGRCRSLKTPKKRSNSGSQRRRLIPALSLDTPSPVRKPANSTGVRWVDGPLRSAQRGLGEPFEIKVYEIDDVERLQRRRGGNSKEVTCFNAKLKILEHRQQRIAEVRAKYEWLMKELEMTKQYLMLDPNKWLSEFDLEQVWELDSLEYLEALECVTERLESRVNFCKAHLMMITCFDITSRRR